MMNENLVEKLNKLIRNNRYDEIISSFTLEERIEFVKNYEISASYASNIIFKSLFTREEATLLYKNRIDEFDDVTITYVISPLDDLEKDEYLSRTRETGCNDAIIKTFDSDEKKIKHLDEISESFDRALLISNFKLDEDKIKCLDYVISSNYMRKIIESFSNEENKFKELYRVSYEGDRQLIIEKFSSDELKLRALKYITNEENKLEIISGFKSEQLKQTLLDGINSLTLSSKEKITQSPNDLYKSILIKQLKSDEEKLNMLDELNDEYYKLVIIKGFKSDKLKLEALKGIKNQYAKLEILQSLMHLSYNDAVKFISDMSKDILKAEVISLLSTDDEKEKCLSLLTTDFSKAYVIRRFDEDLYKQRAINELTIENYKADVIISINSKSIILEEIKKLTNKSFKLSIAQYYLREPISLQILAQCKVPYSYLKKVIDNYGFIPDDIGIPHPFVDIYSEALSLKLEHLSTFVDKFGLKTLNFINNENLQSLINLDDEMFNKYINLLTDDNLKLNMSIINDMLNAYLSSQFKKENEDLCNIFSMIRSTIDNGNELELINTIKFIINSFIDSQALENGIIYDLNSNDEHYKLYKLLNEIIENYSNLKGFSSSLILGDTLALNKLHDITNYYIMYYKNHYINSLTEKTLSSMNLKRVYNKNNLIKYLMQKQVTPKMLLKIVKPVKDKLGLSRNALNLIEDEETLNAIFKFKKNPSISFDDDSIRNKVLENLVVFNEIFSKLYDKDLLPSPNYKDIEFEYVPRDITNEEYINLICNINTPHLCDLMKDENKYNDLIEILSKYKFLGFGYTFSSELDKMGLISGIEASYILINYYEQIRNHLNEFDNNKCQNVTMINMLKLISTFGENSIKYKMLFGESDYFLLKTDPAPETSLNMFAEDRLKSASEYVKRMYQRNYITVPAFDQNITLENGKTINVVVGNSTNMMNLTYGERTGSCMRIGGVGESLFDFCITNPNGFHIRFSSESNNFISRVSGFRNGNTVFLNELRYTKDDNYSDDDLVNCCSKVSDMFIELTKNKNYPIQNVIISKCFAMMNDKTKEKVCLPVSNIKAGLGNFYSDVSSINAVLLASSSNIDQLKINLGGENTDRYALVRDKICRYEANEIEQIQEHKARLEIINQLLSGVDFCDVVYEKKEISEIKSASFGEDWYIIIDDDGNIRKYIMPNSLNMSLAEDELNDEIELMSKKMSLKGNPGSHK